ncbi:MAG: pilus assembly protein [Acidobacteriales bacterium]|nr:pilus assembly protein [Terriglobales bacterium]
MKPQRSNPSRAGQRGFTLITAGACCIVMIGMVGLAVDVGRLYIVRNEVQAHVDTAALSAALELDGTTTGFDRARTTVTNNANRWNMATTRFTTTQTDFSTSQTGPWVASPANGAGYIYARVRATVAAPVYFTRFISPDPAKNVSAIAIAGQVSKTSWKEGLTPFSPLAHNSAGPDFGLVKGGIYTLRWASNPKLNSNVCPGDNQESYIAQSNAGGGEERGFIEESSAANIRAAIVDNYQTIVREVGDSVVMTGGAKQTQRDALIQRIYQDTDSTSSTFAQYIAGGAGNGRRIVVVPINTWHPDYIILGYGAFLLMLPNEYVPGGNKPFCAEYIGAYVQGAPHTGGGMPGAYVVRLVL